MWEITLIGSDEDYFDLKEVCDILMDIFDKDIIIALNFGEQTICSIATNRDSIIKFLENVIYETIIKINKKHYFYNNLNKSFTNNSLISFIISSIVSIDLNEEIEYAKKTTKLSRVINIQSFLYFKLHKIVVTWGRIARYLNVTYSNQMQEELYLQFLKFIADNNQSYIDVVYLEENLDEMILLDRNGNKLKTIPSKDEISIIVNLIIYSPQKLIINCVNSLSNKVTNLISYIFRDKISVIL